MFVSFRKGFEKDIVPATISSWIKQTVVLCYQLSDQTAQDLHQVRAHDVLRLFREGFLWTRGRFHEKSQFETSFGLSLGLKSETFVLAEFLAQIDFTKGDSAETGLKS